MSSPSAVRSIAADDRPMVARLVRQLWDADIAIAHGTVFRPAELPGLLAVAGDDDVLGLLTYRFPEPATMEIVTINALRAGEGVGSALLAEAVRTAGEHGCRRLVLTTTNDNLRALRFYQRRGFRLIALRPGAMTEARKLKPEIPATGAHGIPLTDELDLELAL